MGKGVSAGSLWNHHLMVAKQFHTHLAMFNLFLIQFFFFFAAHSENGKHSASLCYFLRMGSQLFFQECSESKKISHRVSGGSVTSFGICCESAMKKHMLLKKQYIVVFGSRYGPQSVALSFLFVCLEKNRFTGRHFAECRSQGNEPTDANTLCHRWFSSSFCRDNDSEDFVNKMHRDLEGLNSLWKADKETYQWLKITLKLAGGPKKKDKNRQKNTFRVWVYFGTRTRAKKKLNLGERITLILFTKIECDLVPLGGIRIK